ncbi:cell envelope integrity protein TolA [Kurthia huakuii]|uniref:cell envelope integrity protein TolA n=1 Tax=Kurthia huakuii TaxID=1421019 RepID=UPI000494EB91|nr:hypothetical protein [Kurthia huakuii]MBM7698693.1 hypothetical protein [Kurthia huakuii]
MKLLLVNDIDTLKSTDNATQVELAVLDEEQQRIDLSQFTTIAVQIGSNGSLYSTETPIVNEEMNTFSFTLSSELPAGTYSIQVNLTTADNKLHIAPNAGTQRLLIEKSFNEVGETIPIISIKSLLDDMAETLVIAKDAKTVADEAKTQVTQAVEASENAVSQVEGAVASANQAVQSSTDAVAVANEAKDVAQTATATSSEAMTQADSAKTLSTQATTDATKAKTDASNALSTANSAKSTAESVESRFNELTEGNTNDEVIQARTDDENTTHATLKARLDHEATARKNADAQTLADAKSYTDTKVGNVDLSALATKSELTEGLATKVNTVEGKGLSTNDYTDADKSKLDGISNGANNYTLPVATSGILGGVKVAVNTGIELTSGGTISTATLKKSVDDHLIDSLSHVFYCGASSGVNAKIISNAAVKSYVEGLQVKFKNSDANTGNVTVNINGLGTKKLLSFAGAELKSAELRVNMVYNVVYNGADFFLASGGVNTGDATALSNDILSGKTAYVDGQKVTGTMANRGGITEYIAPNDTITIPEGYHNGSGKVVQQVNTKGAETFIPKTVDQQILVGQLLVGTQTIKGDANLVGANIVSGKSIFGVNGSAEKTIKPMSNTLLNIVGDVNSSYKLSSIDSDSNYYFLKNGDPFTGTGFVFEKYSYNGNLLSSYSLKLTTQYGKLLGYTKHGYCYIDNSNYFIIENSNKNIIHSQLANNSDRISDSQYVKAAWYLGGDKAIYPYDTYGANAGILTNFKTLYADLGFFHQETAVLTSKDEIVYYYGKTSMGEIYIANTVTGQKRSARNTKIALGSYIL